MKPEGFYQEHERLLTEIKALGGLLNEKDAKATKQDIANDGRRFLDEMMETRLTFLRSELAKRQAEVDRARREQELQARLARAEEEEKRERRKSELERLLQGEQQRQEQLAAARAELAAK